MRKAALTSLLAGGVAIAGLAPLAATPAAAAAPVPVRTVVVSKTSIHLLGGGPLHAGRITFKVVSGDGKPRALQIARLHAGYSFRVATADLQKAFRGDVAAVRRVDRNITYKGGANGVKGKPGEFTVTLHAGLFVFVRQSGNVHRWVRVVGKPVARTGVTAQGSITAFVYGFGDVSPNAPASGLLRLYNRSDQPHFFVFNHVKSDTTRKEVAKFFKNPQGQPTFALPGQTSSGVLSPFNGEVMKVDLPAGKYLVQCYWPDWNTGMPHAFMGMWKLIILH